MSVKVKVINIPDKKGILIDEETGEKIEHRKKKIKKFFNNGEDSRFYLMYASILPILIEEDLSKSSIKTFAYLIEKFGGSGMFDIGSSVRSELMERCGLAENTVFNSIKELIRCELLIKANKIKKGGYSINARYIWIGTSDARKKQIEIQLNLNND